MNDNKRKPQRRPSFKPLLYITGGRPEKLDRPIAPVALVIQSQPPRPSDDRPAPGLMRGSFLQACIAAVKKAEWIAEAEAREQRRKSGLAKKEEFRKAAAGLEADDIKHGRPPASGRHHLKKLKV